MSIPPADREMFDKMNREQLYDYIFMQIKNIWRVDGLYFLGIEKRHDMQEATDVDADCWQYMGKVEAKEIKKFLGIDQPPDPAGVLWALRHTSWAVSHDLKSWSQSEGRAEFSVDTCRTQVIRLDKGLETHPCRQVREKYLDAFVKEMNPEVKLVCVSCPPDRTTDEVWCRWAFEK